MLDIRYVAGLFDGEGWVRAELFRLKHRPTPSYQVKAGIGMTDMPIIKLLHEQFGGGFSENASAHRKNPKNRPGYCWGVASNVALNFLYAVTPFLIVKKEQAILAIELQEHIRDNKHIMNGYGRTHEARAPLYAHREKLALQIKALKKPLYSLVDSDPINASI